MANVMNGLVYRGVVTFLPTHLSSSVGRSIAGLDPVMLGGSFTTVALIFGVAGQFSGGYFSDKRRREGLALISLGVAAPALLGVWAFTGTALLVAAAGFAFFSFMSQPVFNSLIADYCPDCWRGRMYGFYFFCSFGVGSFSASALGYVAESRGVSFVFLVCAVLSLIAAGFIVPFAYSCDSQRAARRNATTLVTAFWRLRVVTGVEGFIVNIDYECIACFVRQARETAERATTDDTLRWRVMRSVCALVE